MYALYDPHKLTWKCINNKTSEVLFIIEYDKKWRQWVALDFDMGLVMSGDCFKDTSDFLNQLNQQGR